MTMNLELRRRMAIAAIAGAASVGLMSHANADPIFSAVDGVINSGGPGFGTLTETINQAGLSANYVSGVTDFAAYIASNPTHTPTFAGFEWFSNLNSTSASVTYNLGTTRFIDGLALWNEESAGIGLLDLLYSTDGTSFTSLATGIVPVDNPLAPYSAQVIGFGGVNLQYIRLDMSQCPQQPSIFPACSIGEVAFRGTEQVTAVPEPGSLALLGLAFAGAAVARIRKKTA